MEITFIRAGMLTTVQDLGRTGHRAAGVPLSGAMDAFALRLANLLVGNAQNTAAFEVTLIGPDLVFSQDTLIAVTGAEFPGVPSSAPFIASAGQALKLGAASKGCRGYLAVAGGLELPPVLGSFATNLRDAFGGFEGRALRDGDRVRGRTVARKVADHWHIDLAVLPPYSTAPRVRVISGPQAAEFNDDWLGHLFKVTSRSDRMGLRLSGPELKRQRGGELRSAAVTPGTVQVPPDGQPIVLMADAQTIGGYPQLAQVASVDFPLVAQLRPGDSIAFQKISLDDAHRQLAAREHAFALLQEGLAQKIF